MNTKSSKIQNPNKKRLLLTKSSKQSLGQGTQSTMATSCFHPTSSEQKQKIYDQKHLDSTILPPIIDPLSKSRISISQPPESSKTRRKYSQTIISNSFSRSKALQPSFFGHGKNRCFKVEEIINLFIQDFLSRNIFNNHFGKYLVQPKSLFKILLFAINSFNNSKNLYTFHKNISNFDNYQELERLLQKQQFYFCFAVRNNKKLTMSYQEVNLNIQNQYRINLQSEGQVLANKNQQLLQEIVEKRDQLQRLQKTIIDHQRQIEALSSEERQLNVQITKQNDYLFTLRNSIRESEQICERLQLGKRHFNSFMINFNENKCGQLAIRTKRLEQDLHQYAQYLNFHPLGKRTYEKSKYSCEMQKMLINQHQQFWKYLSGEECSVDVKMRLMRDFMNKAREEYSRIINELMIVIQEKTELISTFTKKISVWQQNYQNKKSLLAELSRVLQFQALNIEEMKVFRQCGGDNYRYSKQVNTQKEMKIIAVAEKIVTLYRIASTFV